MAGSWKVQSAAALAVLMVALLGTVAIGAEPTPIHGRVDNPIVVRGCAIRLEAHPYLLTNSAHSCTGFRQVSYVHGWLEVVADSSLPVVSIAVSPDESLVSRGIIAGASGGGSHTRVRFYSTRTHRVVSASSASLHCPKCNVWVTITSFGPEPEQHQSGSSPPTSG